MTVWSANFNTDTTGSAPASTVTDTYGTLTWSASPGGSATVSTTQFFDGGKSLAANTGSSPVSTFYYVASAGATTHFRVYVYLGAAPAANVALMSVRDASNSSYNAIGISGTRQLYATFNASNAVTPGGGSANYTSSTNVVPTGQWVRIEGKITATSVQARMWTIANSGGVNGTGTADLDSGSLTGASIGTLGQLNFGFHAGSSFTNGATAYMDGLAIDTADWVGPGPRTIANFEQTTNAQPAPLDPEWYIGTLPANSSSDYFNDTTRFVTGAKSGKVTSTATYAHFYKYSGIAANNYFRGYYYLPAAPTRDHSIMFLQGGGYANTLMVGFATNRSLWVSRNPTNSSSSTTGTNRYNGSANQLPTGEWMRVEGYLSATSYQVKVWTASGAGIHSTGTPDIDTGSTAITTLGALDFVAIGADSASGTFTAGMSIDDLAHSPTTWVGASDVSTVTHSAAAAASETATGAAAATATRVMAGAPSITASAEAVAGKVLSAEAASTVTIIGAADAAVLTTHLAEAAAEATVASAAEAARTLGLNAAASVTASAVATMASDTDANGQVQAIGVARVVIDGETSPGFLYATVAKNILTN